jgi:hypothetical protein
MHAGVLAPPVARADAAVQIAIDDRASAQAAQLQRQLGIGRDELDLHVGAVLRDHGHAGDRVLDLHRGCVGGARGGRDGQRREDGNRRLHQLKIPKPNPERKLGPQLHGSSLIRLHDFAVIQSLPAPKKEAAGFPRRPWVVSMWCVAT